MPAAGRSSVVGTAECSLSGPSMYPTTPAARALKSIERSSGVRSLNASPSSSARASLSGSGDSVTRAVCSLGFTSIFKMAAVSVSARVPVPV